MDALTSFNLTTAPEVQLQHIGTHVRDYFEHIAPRWDSYVASAYERDLQDRLSKLLPWHQTMNLLDGGTGSGYPAEILAPPSAQAIGADCSPAMANSAHPKMCTAAHRHSSLR